MDQSCTVLARRGTLTLISGNLEALPKVNCKRPFNCKTPHQLRDHLPHLPSAPGSAHKSHSSVTMPKFFCDYCDVYLTHDSMSVRKAHNSGRNHLRNVVDYYQQIGHEKAQSVIDSITSSYAAEGQAHANPMLPQNQPGGHGHGPPPGAFPPSFNFGAGLPPPFPGMPGAPPMIPPGGAFPQGMMPPPGQAGAGRGMPPPFANGPNGLPMPPGGLPFPPPAGLPFPPPGSAGAPPFPFPGMPPPGQSGFPGGPTPPGASAFPPPSGAPGQGPPGR
ncbi:U1 zinc finger-domain-containing protein [Xylariaceae sp. FL1019]|nr:U1 zinc finger-domain-containing protein [Xylariaceae sp. FL1019]